MSVLAAGHLAPREMTEDDRHRRDQPGQSAVPRRRRAHRAAAGKKCPDVRARSADLRPRAPQLTLDERGERGEVARHELVRVVTLDPVIAPVHHVQVHQSRWHDSP